jgi:hypothetical protein
VDATPFPVSDLPETYLSFYERLVALGPSAARALTDKFAVEPRRFDAICTADRAFNAYAWTRSGADQIAFTAALPCLLHFCFNHLLTSPDLLPDVGDVSGEGQARFPRGIPLLLETDTTLLEAVVVVPGLSRPNDDARAVAASALTELACMFTVLHEVGHVACGHTRFSELRLSGEPVSEFFDLTGIFRRRRFLRQVWEMEADMIASMLLMQWITGPEPNRVFLSEAFAIDASHGYEYDAIAAVLVALYVLFLYMNQRERATRRFRSHPPPLVRVTYAHNVLRLFAKHDLRLDVHELDARVDEAVLQVNAAWRALGLQVPPYAGDPLDHMSLLMRQRDRLATHYGDLAWLPPTIWRRADDEFYSYDFLRS